MTIDNLVRLIEGELLTSPSISSINNIEFSAKKIKQADAFIYTGIEDLKEAIDKGAYAVIFDKENIEITDKEIAWIRVKSLKRALIRILRFYLTEKSIKVLYANELVLQIIESATTQKENLLFIKDSIYEIFQKVLHAKENSIIIGNDEDLLRKIYPDFKPLEKKSAVNVINQTLFETTFIHNDKFFKNIKIPPIFIKELETALDFFESYQIRYDLYNLSFLQNHFEPVFINSRFIQMPFGSTQKVLIFEKDKNLLEKEILFLQKEAKWANKKVFVPDNLNLRISNTDIHKFKDFKNIKLIKNFHLGIIYGEKEEFFHLLTPKEQNNISLFKELN